MTEAELRDAIRATFPYANDINIISNKPFYVSFWVVEFQAHQLMQLSELIDLSQVTLDGHHRVGGCDTCDYGEENGVKISFTL